MRTAESAPPWPVMCQCGRVALLTHEPKMRGRVVTSCGRCNGDPDSTRKVLLVPTPTRAGRAGDSQPMPTPNDHPDVQSAVIADIEARRALGISRYGTALQPHNGRDALLDAYEEVLDLAMYLKQRLIEDKA